MKDIWRRMSDRAKGNLLAVAGSVGIFCAIAAARLLDPFGPPEFDWSASFLAEGRRWHARDVTWRAQGDGVLFLEMILVPGRGRGQIEEVRVTPKTVYALCGSVLSALPLRDGDEVARTEVSQLHLFFQTDRDGKELVVLPWPVNDGACHGAPG